MILILILFISTGCDAFKNTKKSVETEVMDVAKKYLESLYQVNNLDEIIKVKKSNNRSNVDNVSDYFKIIMKKADNLKPFATENITNGVLQVNFIGYLYEICIDSNSELSLESIYFELYSKREDRIFLDYKMKLRFKNSDNEKDIIETEGQLSVVYKDDKWKVDTDTYGHRRTFIPLNEFHENAKKKLISSPSIEFVKSKGYNIISYKEQYDNYVLSKQNIVKFPLIEIWGVQLIDPSDYIGKTIIVDKFIVQNHPLDMISSNSETKTNLCIMICDNKVIGGYSLPDYKDVNSGGFYSLDGYSLKDITKLSYLDFKEKWYEKFK